MVGAFLMLGVIRAFSCIKFDYMFKMTAENIANFIGKNAYSADKIIPHLAPI